MLSHIMEQHGFNLVALKSINKNYSIMKTRKLYFDEYHVAGRQYHDADDVWSELKVGTKLSLVRDTDNRFDPNAVAIVYTKCDDDSSENEEYTLGYIPRCENENIAAFLEMGWTEIFECRICKLNPEAHYEEQIHVSVKIINRQFAKLQQDGNNK